MCCAPLLIQTNLVLCSRDGADSLLLHVGDSVKAGYRKVCVRTVNTDVVILAIAHYNNIRPEELWMAFGT